MVALLASSLELEGDVASAARRWRTDERALEEFVRVMQHLVRVAPEVRAELGARGFDMATSTRELDCIGRALTAPERRGLVMLVRAATRTAISWRRFQQAAAVTDRTVIRWRKWSSLFADGGTLESIRRALAFESVEELLEAAEERGELADEVA